MTPEMAIRALQRQHLFPFVWRAFGLLHPGQPFLPAWHVQAMGHRLEQVAAEGPKRLVITVPPRHGKSICTAVCLPAWLLGHRPDRKIMVASYGGELAVKHARDFRTVLTSPWHQDLFPSCRRAVGGNRADGQITAALEGRKAVSLGGAAPGFGADLIIVDDLMKAADARFSIERQRVWDYYGQTLVSRLNDKTDGRIVVIQQRLHEDDLPGYLLESGQFTHLDLPAIAKENEDVSIGLGRAKRRLKGEARCPEREPLETYLLPATPTPWLAELRRELMAFPAGRYDDQVDGLVQFVACLGTSRSVCASPRPDHRDGPWADGARGDDGGPRHGAAGFTTGPGSVCETARAGSAPSGKRRRPASERHC